MFQTLCSSPMEILEGEEKIGCITHIWPIDGSYKKKKSFWSHMTMTLSPSFMGYLYVSLGKYTLKVNLQASDYFVRNHGKFSFSLNLEKNNNLTSPQPPH
jgi:hypothetical protein